MRILNHSLPLFALAYVSDALVQCNTTIHSYDHCRLRKRPTYVHVDDFGFDTSMLLEWKGGDDVWVKHIKDLVTAGADYILMNGGLMEDTATDGLTSSAARFYALSNEMRIDLRDFIREEGAKLILTVGGDPQNCDAVSPTPQGSADYWCRLAVFLGFDGINWNLDRLTKSNMDDPNVEWFLNATEICRPFTDMIMYSVQGDRLTTHSPSPIDAIIEAAEPNDRLLLHFRDVRGPLASSYTKDAKAISQLLASMEDRVPNSKGKLVVGKVLYGSACSRSVSLPEMTDLMEHVEKDGFTGGVVLSKAPAYDSQHSHDFVTTFLPNISRRRTGRTQRRFLSATADNSESLDASS